jgi:hypothetical protein
MTEMHLPDPDQVPLEDIPLVLLKLTALESQLATRLLLERSKPEQTGPEEVDELITTKLAAAELNVEIDWLYRHAKTLPFSRRLSRKCLRFSRRGLVAWRNKRRG